MALVKIRQNVRFVIAGELEPPVTSPTYTPIVAAEFSGGVDGEALNETDFTAPVERAIYSDDIAGPFGGALTGKFLCRESSNVFGGNFQGMNGVQTPNNSSI